MRIDMKKYTIHFLLNDDGVTSVEYAFIAVVVVVAIAGTLPLIGSSVSRMFRAVLDGFP